MHKAREGFKTRDSLDTQPILTDEDRTSLRHLRRPVRFTKFYVFLEPDLNRNSESSLHPSSYLSTAMARPFAPARRARNTAEL